MQTKIKTPAKSKTATAATPETIVAPIVAPIAETTETRNAYGLTEKQSKALATANAKNPASPPFKFAKRCEKIDLATSKAFKRDTDKFTARLTIAHAGLVAAFQPYGNEPFQARILDNGQAAIFINSGFLAAINGTGQQSDSLMRDSGSDLLMLQLTDKALSTIQPVKS